MEGGGGRFEEAVFALAEEVVGAAAEGIVVGGL